MYTANTPACLLRTPRTHAPLSHLTPNTSQDAMSSSLQPLLQTDIHIPVHTVYSMLEQNGALAMLRDPAIRTATREIRDDKSKTRAEIQVPTHITMC